MTNILGYSIPYLRGELVELLGGVSRRARVIDLLRSHGTHIYTYSMGHMMCAQTMFGRAWHALSIVRSQALQADQSRE